MILPRIFLLATTSLAEAEEFPVDPADDFSPMLALFALIALAIILILVGIGIVIGLIIMISAAILAALGIVSSATLIGIARGRLSSGLRALHYQIFAVASMPAAVGLLWLANHLFDLHLPLPATLLLGSLAGLAGGLTLAFALDRISGIAYRYFYPSPSPSEAELLQPEADSRPKTLPPPP